MSKKDFFNQGPAAYILVVEDDTDIRETVRDFLEVEGYLVATAIHGKDALDFLHEAEIAKKLPCCIVLDISMPVMNGIEFLQEIESRYQKEFGNIPVIIATANPQYLTSEIKIKCASKLKKPYDIDELISSIKPFCLV